MMITTDKKIMIRMIETGISGSEIARKEGVHRTAIYHVIKGRVKSKRLRKAICKALRLPESIWHEIDGNRKKAA